MDHLQTIKICMHLVLSCNSVSDRVQQTVSQYKLYGRFQNRLLDMQIGVLVRHSLLILEYAIW